MSEEDKSKGKMVIDGDDLHQIQQELIERRIPVLPQFLAVGQLEGQLNYGVWKVLMESVLETGELFAMVSQPLPRPKVTDGGSSSSSTLFKFASNEWDKLNARVRYLNDNWLTGGIPSQLALIGNLEILYLSHNKLTGPVPEALAFLPRLTYLYLNNNMLTGRIPEPFYQHQTLKEMYIDGNNFNQGVKPIGVHRTMELSDTEFLF